MKNLLPFLAASWASGPEQPFAVVINTQGEAAYSPDENGNFQPLRSGLVLSREAVIRLQNEATAHVYSNGRSYEVRGQGLHQLQGIIPAENQVAMGVANEFHVMVRAAADGSGGSTSSTGKIGFGKGKHKVQPLQPYQGKVSDELRFFQWRPSPEVRNYRVELLDTSDNKIYDGSTSESRLAVNPDQLKLQPGQTYRWRVREDGSSETVFDEPSFTFMEAAERERALEQARSLELYRSDDAVTRSLLEAVALERAGWNYAAYLRYSDLRAQHPDNDLVRRMLAQYWYRHEQPELGDELMGR